MVKDRFHQVFGYRPRQAGFTPGRVNLIGEHTDYNGGMVLPTALELGINLALSPRNDNQISISSDKFDDMATRSTQDVANEHWSDYITGALILGNEVGLIDGGADVAAQTNLPFGAGISSSAAVTVGVLKLLRTHAQSILTDSEIAVLARRVENEFIGMPCGIMDQMAVAIAHPGQALALDTANLNYELVDLPKSYHMAVVHSGQFRQLNEGRYKERKEECDAIKLQLGHDNICLMDDREFSTLNVLSNTLQRRAKHCMTDHRRTSKSVELIRTGKIEAFGKLMTESHISMRDDFEITVPKVDALVDSAVELGALGARQTGGGFGGCIVACVVNDQLDDWRNNLLSRHPEAFWVA